MKCRVCGSEKYLETVPYEDEDGFITDEPIPLCIYCVEVEAERSREAAEYRYYHEGD